ncbi:MAG: PAS domain S-box protein, partial [Gammaproteobacteria bacterium]
MNPLDLVIAEDSGIQAKVLERVLTHVGHSVRWGSAGDEALKLCREKAPDVLISDVMMPRMNGFELCDAMRADDRTRQVPILLLTTLADPKDILRGLSAGADDYLIKPYEEDSLLAKVEELSTRRQPPGNDDALEFAYRGESFQVRADRHQILRMLTETFENVIAQNRDLIEAQGELQVSRRELKDRLLELEASDARVRELFNGMPSGFIRIQAGRIVEANPWLTHISGYSQEELLAEDFSPARLFGGPERFEELLATLNEEHSIRGIHLDLRDARGEFRVIEVSAIRAQADDDEPYYSAFVRDITARVRAEEELRGSEQRFRSIVELVPDVIYRVDPDGHFTFLNNATRRLGYEPEDLIGKHFSTILEAADVERVSRARVLPAIEGRKTGDDESPKLFDERRTAPRGTSGLEVKLKPADRSTQVQGTVVPLVGEVSSAGMYIEDPNTHEPYFLGSVGAIRDITDRKRYEDQINQLNTDLERKVEERTREVYTVNRELERTVGDLYKAEEQLIAGEKLSAMGSLVAGVAHELNNPLMGIINYVQFVRSKNTDEKLGKYLEKAERDARRASQVATNMLRYARGEAPTTRSVDLAQTVAGTLELLQPELKARGIELTAEIDAGLPAAEGTSDGLQQVLINLILNARDALTGRDTPTVRLHAQGRASKLEISVCDNGPGIPLNVQRRIFDPFFTTKEPGKGTGLGLAICTRLVSSFGGTISYEPSPDGGACFRVNLRTAQNNEGAESPTAGNGASESDNINDE